MKKFSLQCGFVFRLVFAVGVLLGSLTPPRIFAAEGRLSEPAVPAATNEMNDGEPAPGQRSQPIPSEWVKIGGSQKMAADESATDVVTVFGSSDVSGSARQNMVTVFGGAKMNGRVGRDMVTVFGNAEVNGPVGHDLVVVFGSLKLGSNAAVNHDCVAVFGRIDRDPKAVLCRPPIEVMPWFSSLGDYLRDGPLMGRPLPPQSGLAWTFVGLFFVIYLLVAIILPKPTAACVRQLDQRPLLTFGVGVLTSILLALLNFILAATMIGFALIPFIVLVEMGFIILGKASALEFFGRQIIRRFSPDTGEHRILAFFLGFALVTLLYMVPILGLLAWMAFRPLALGAAVMSLAGAFGRSGNGGAAPAPGIPVQLVPPTIPAGAGFETSGGNPPPVAPPVFPSASLPSGILTGAEMAVLPRTGFWIRLGATALDFVLLVWLIPLVHVFFPIVWMAYHVAMWTWKGTTMGGIVCKLKLVRVDGRAVDFGVSLVRALASVFSTLALFLGFFWAGWSHSRQSWHDLIAGTVIVKIPDKISLV